MPGWLYRHDGFLERSVCETFIVVCVALSAWCAVQMARTIVKRLGRGHRLVRGSRRRVQTKCGAVFPRDLVLAVALSPERSRASLGSRGATGDHRGDRERCRAGADSAMALAPRSPGRRARCRPGVQPVLRVAGAHPEGLCDRLLQGDLAAHEDRPAVARRWHRIAGRCMGARSTTCDRRPCGPRGVSGVEPQRSSSSSTAPGCSTPISFRRSRRSRCLRRGCSSNGRVDQSAQES